MGAAGSPKESQVEQLLQANQRFTGSFSPTELSDRPARRLAVVTCMDCRLTGLLEPAIGVARGDAVVIRNAGNTAAPNDDVLRSLVQAVYGLGVREVVVVGHTGCGMANFDTTAFLSAMSAAGVPRDAIPSMDLRAWMGAFGSVRDNVEQTAGRIVGSSLFPRGLLEVHGLIIDTVTGRIERVL